MNLSQELLQPVLVEHPSQPQERTGVYTYVPKKTGLRISIITVTYNSAGTIKDTLESIKNQDYPHIEHIIIDGGSKDNTMDIVAQYPHVAIKKSEKDKGIYDAMNKGLKLATGDIIGILNSDDMYASNQVLSKVASRFKNENRPVLYGDLQYVHQNNLDKVVRTWVSGTYTKSSFYYGWMPPHPTVFFRRWVYDEVGLFNTSFRVAADYEMMLRVLFKKEYKASYLNEILVKMRTGGVSNDSFKNRLRTNQEDKVAWQINDLHPRFYTLYLKPIRKISQFFRRKW